MKRLLCLAGLSLVGCASAPISYHAVTTSPGDASYACALRKVNELSYTITNTNKDARFITAEKQTSGLGTKFLTGKTYHDQLTVSVFDIDSTSRKMRVTAASIEESTNIFTSSRTGKKPSDSAMADANALLAACSTGPITKEGENALQGVAGSE